MEILLLIAVLSFVFGFFCGGTWSFGLIREKAENNTAFEVGDKIYKCVEVRIDK